MTVFVSKHAVTRYQERIENVPMTEVCSRIRTTVAPHILTAPGEYRISSRKKGPPFDVIVVVFPGGQAEVKTIFPVTNTQITRALKDKSWYPSR